MRLVFQENPKFGDEQDVTQQIVSIDDNIEKLHAEIKRFEVNFHSVRTVFAYPMDFLVVYR